MPPAKSRQRLGFFTRLLDQAPAPERYRLADEQIARAEAFGFDAIWVAQHHFHEAEGGLPAPFALSQPYAFDRCGEPASYHASVQLLAEVQPFPGT